MAEPSAGGAPDVLVSLRAAGVGLVLDLRGGRLPAIAHWGADLGELDLAQAAALVDAGTVLPSPSTPDVPVHVAIVPEHWAGWTGRPGLLGARDGAHWSPRFTTTLVEIDGDALPTNRPVLHAGGAASVRVEAFDDTAALALTLWIELAPSGLVRARARVSNTAASPYDLAGLTLAFPVPSIAAEVLDLTGRWGRERCPQRRPFVVGTQLRENRTGRTGADAATVMHAGTSGFGFGHGEVWGVHVGWSGNHLAYAERVSTGVAVLGGGESLWPGEGRLAGGTAYTTPWVYAAHGTGLDGVAARFHNYLRARPQHPGSRRPVTINVWEAVYFDHSLPALLELAEIAAAVGVERYVLDDGWFGSRRSDHSGLGDWVVSPDAWPDGLHPLIDRVRELGMEFGLWVEPEMVNLDSDLARAHPEWVMGTGGRTPVPARRQQVLNLSIPACYDHIRDALTALLRDYPIAYLKWDHNRDLLDAGTWPHGEAAVHAQTEAAYRLIAELKATHPGLEIESCSSGGARVDLGILEHTDRVWASDCIDPHERQQIVRWTQQLVPLELIGAHIASGVSHTTGRAHTLGFRAATAMFGHLGIEWDLRQATPAERAELADWIAVHKAHRELLFSGTLVRIDHPDPSLSAFGIVAADGSEALYSLAQLERSPVVSLGRIRLPGLDPDRRYRVTPVRVGASFAGLTMPGWWREDGAVFSGAVLGRAGLIDARVLPDEAVIYHCEAIA